MNWWPWVSRRAYDEVVRQRDRLELQNDKLFDHGIRMDRREHGLGEVQPSGKPKPELSDDVVAEIRRWSSTLTKEQLTKEAQRLYASGKTNEEVLDAIKQD